MKEHMKLNWDNRKKVVFFLLGSEWKVILASSHLNWGKKRVLMKIFLDLWLLSSILINWISRRVVENPTENPYTPIPSILKRIFDYELNGVVGAN